MSHKKYTDTTHNSMKVSKINFTSLLQQNTCPWRKFSQNTSRLIVIITQPLPPKTNKEENKEIVA